MSGYRLRPRAEADLSDIWSYTAGKWSVAQADRYYRELIDAVQALGDRPTLGRSCDDIREGYRRHNVASHVVFYVVAQDHVEVIRILHSSRDFRSHLPKS